MFSEEIEYEGFCTILESLTEWEMESMPDPNLPLRHLRADAGNIVNAIKRTKYALRWRKDFQVEKIIRAAHNPATDEESNLRNILMKESSPGKMYVRNHDKVGRAILYMYGARSNGNHPVHNIQHLVYELERAIANTEKNGYEKIVIIMDYAGWGMKHAPSMGVVKETIHVLQECYVERLSRVYITNAPLVFRAFYSIVKPFLDPLTKEKIVFCAGKAGKEELENFFDLAKVEECALGTANLKGFDVKEYFNAPLSTTFDE